MERAVREYLRRVFQSRFLLEYDELVGHYVLDVIRVVEQRVEHPRIGRVEVEYQLEDVLSRYDADRLFALEHRYVVYRVLPEYPRYDAQFLAVVHRQHVRGHYLLHLNILYHIQPLVFYVFLLKDYTHSPGPVNMRPREIPFNTKIILSALLR